jgi:hypothetical protein
MFDPLTAGQAARLSSGKEPGTRLLVIVETGAEALLPLDARAVMVAALRGVDAVCPVTPEEWNGLADALSGKPIQYDRLAEQNRSRAFVRLVLDRQAAASAVGNEAGK